MEHGDPAQDRFEAVYHDLKGPVFRFCLAQLGDAAAAEDLAADVFAAAWAAFRRSPPEPDGVRPWLFRIARNGAIDRSRRRRTQASLLARLRGDAVSVEETAEVRDELRAAVAAIGRLRARDRLLVGLRVAAGLDWAEIGSVAGMSADAARMATARALAKVRQEVREP